MSLFFRFFLFLFLFTTALSIERTLGLPFISLIIASNFVVQLGRVGKTIGILTTGILMSLSYLIPLWLGVVLVAGLVYALEQRLILFHRETITYFGFVLLAVFFLAVVAHFPFTVTNLAYHFFLAISCFFFIRYWFMKRTNKWKMY